jgi:hypothetical protein
MKIEFDSDSLVQMARGRLLLMGFPKGTVEAMQPRFKRNHADAQPFSLVMEEPKPNGSKKR